MKTRLILSAGMLLGLSGCVTYDYVDDGSGGYYHGSPQVQRNYPYGYPGSYGSGSYGGYYDYYGSYGYPVYRPRYNPPPRPPQGGHGHGHQGHRPPPHGNGHHPPQRPDNGDGRPTRPPPADGGKSPWRDMDRLQRPQPRGPRSGATEQRPMQRPMPAPQSMPSQRPSMPQRAAPERRTSHNRDDRGVRQQEL